MATNFGFMPVLKGKRYFISYKSEDTERVGEITRKLNEMGVPTCRRNHPKAQRNGRAYVV